jgi:hypothetical protein
MGLQGGVCIHSVKSVHQGTGAARGIKAEQYMRGPGGCGEAKRAEGMQVGVKLQTTHRQKWRGKWLGGWGHVNIRVPGEGGDSSRYIRASRPGSRVYI